MNMRDKIYSNIKIFELNIFTHKVELEDETVYYKMYNDGTCLCAGVVIDDVAMNLFTNDIYPIFSNYNDYIILNTVYITKIYDYGTKIENENGYFMFNMSVREANELYKKALASLSLISCLEKNNVLSYAKERAKVLQKRLDR